MAKRRNLKRETESLLIAAQNNIIRTNRIKVKADMMQQKSKYSSCDDKVEMINHIISKLSKLAQEEYKSRQNSVGKVIKWELCKKLKFGHTKKLLCTT